MKLKDIGEFGFINRIEPLCKIYNPDVLRGIGDDCAVIRVSPDLNLLVTTDLLVERVSSFWNGKVPKSSEPRR